MAKRDTLVHARAICMIAAIIFEAADNFHLMFLAYFKILASLFCSRKFYLRNSFLKLFVI